MNYLVPLLLHTFLVGAAISFAAPPTADFVFCGIRFDEKMDFSSTEEDWLCGKKESAAWKSIPVSQKRFFLRRFLQDRGYHEPQFHVEGELLVVKTGPLLLAKKFTVTGAPPTLRWNRRRRLIGRTLTPALLDEAAAWVKRELQQSGYPCPDVTARAIISQGAIEIEALPGPPHVFGEMASEGGVDIPHQILDRFTAFVSGQPFDIRLLELSSQRILAQDLYLSTYYDISCPEDAELRIVRRFVPAPPRLVTAGAGFDTERGPLARARFRRVRIGHAANSWENTLLATFREQSFETRYHWYVLKDLRSPFRFMPAISYLREDEEHFEATTLRFSPLFATEWEKREFQWGAELGPSLERVITHRGSSERLVDSGRVVARLRAVSHDYEYYSTRPRAGWSFSLDTNSRVKGFLSRESIQRALLSHDTLWNFGKFDPPFLILGWRGMLGTFFFPERAGATFEIPVSERFFLGGDADIRGFGRKEVPANQRGMLTMIYQGLELRAGEWWRVPLQPLIFFDLAKGGERARRIDRALYYTPGIGLRYQSPIGAVRTTLGRGFVKNPEPASPEGGLQFFLSLGREF